VSAERDRLKAQARNCTDHDLLARLEFPGRYPPDLAVVIALEEIWRRLTGEEGVTIGIVDNRPFAMTEEALRRRAERVKSAKFKPGDQVFAEEINGNGRLYGTVCDMVLDGGTILVCTGWDSVWGLEIFEFEESDLKHGVPERSVSTPHLPWDMPPEL
jgi:hypothetical protein